MKRTRKWWGLVFLGTVLFTMIGTMLWSNVNLHPSAASWQPIAELGARFPKPDDEAWIRRGVPMGTSDSSLCNGEIVAFCAESWIREGSEANTGYSYFRVENKSNRMTAYLTFQSGSERLFSPEEGATRTNRSIDGFESAADQAVLECEHYDNPYETVDCQWIYTARYGQFVVVFAAGSETVGLSKDEFFDGYVSAVDDAVMKILDPA